MSVVNTAPFQLKGSLFTLTVMHLESTDLGILESYLNELLKKSPNLFKSMPVVIDLEQVADQDDLSFKELIHLLQQFGLIPVAVRNGSPAQLESANLAGLGTLKQTQKSKTAPKEPTTTPENTFSSAKIVTQPVRSGQQIYAKDTDLVVLASVSAGSEIISDGHIHVYGTLRGRALAGVKGDTAARIICSALAPELVSIAGRYLLQDTLEIPTETGPFQVFLKNNQITCAKI